MKLVPLPELRRRTAELSKDREIVIYCRTGVRSIYAAEFLMDSGFPKVVNLTGGVHRWSADVDDSVPAY